jgi:hypothetical protein
MHKRNTVNLDFWKKETHPKKNLCTGTHMIKKYPMSTRLHAYMLKEITALLHFSEYNKQ